MFHHRDKGWERPEGKFDDWDLANGWGKQITNPPETYTAYRVLPWHAASEQPRLEELDTRPRTPNEQKKRPITVRVYQFKGGKWVEHSASRYETPTDYDAAVDYYNRVRRMKTWTATWNAPGWPKPQ